MPSRAYGPAPADSFTLHRDGLCHTGNTKHGDDHERGEHACRYTVCPVIMYPLLNETLETRWEHTGLSACLYNPK